MKKTIAILLILSVFSMMFLTACESKEEKQARMQKEAEIINQTAELNQILNQTVIDCSEFEEDNKTFCLAEKAVELSKNSQYHYEVRTEDKSVNELCGAAYDPELCYYYSATMLQSMHFCDYVEDKVGCKLMSNQYYCSTFDSIDDKMRCQSYRAYFTSFFDKEQAKQTCFAIPARYKQYSEDKITCADIDFNEPLNGTVQDGFSLAYLLLNLAELKEYTYRK